MKKRIVFDVEDYLRRRKKSDVVLTLFEVNYQTRIRFHPHILI